MNDNEHWPSPTTVSEVRTIIEAQPELRRLIRRQSDEPERPEVVLLRRPPTPFFIVPVPIGDLPGRLYASRLPGMSPEHARAELQALKDHGIEHIVCLVPTSSLEELHRGTRYLEQVRSTFADGFHQVDILDHQLPANDDHFDRSVTHIRELIHEGRNVLVHCVAGCGRTGMFVACLMVLEGASPIDAIRTFRRHRRCGPDTVEQAAYVVRFANRMASQDDE